MELKRGNEYLHELKSMKIKLFTFCRCEKDVRLIYFPHRRYSTTDK